MRTSLAQIMQPGEFLRVLGFGRGALYPGGGSRGAGLARAPDGTTQQNQVLARKTRVARHLLLVQVSAAESPAPLGTALEPTPSSGWYGLGPRHRGLPS